MNSQYGIMVGSKSLLAALIMEQLVDVLNWRILCGMYRDYIQTGLEEIAGISTIPLRLYNVFQNR